MRVLSSIFFSALMPEPLPMNTFWLLRVAKLSYGISWLSLYTLYFLPRTIIMYCNGRFRGFWAVFDSWSFLLSRVWNFSSLGDMLAIASSIFLTSRVSRVASLMKAHSRSFDRDFGGTLFFLRTTFYLIVDGARKRCSIVWSRELGASFPVSSLIFSYWLSILSRKLLFPIHLYWSFSSILL